MTNIVKKPYLQKWHFILEEKLFKLKMEMRTTSSEKFHIKLTMYCLTTFCTLIIRPIALQLHKHSIFLD